MCDDRRDDRDWHAGEQTISLLPSKYCPFTLFLKLVGRNSSVFREETLLGGFVVDESVQTLNVDNSVFCFRPAPKTSPAQANSASR